jgi:hypothetical protein
MKTILSIFLIIAGMLLIVGCTQLNNSSGITDVTVIRDITDSMMVTPKPEEITNLYGLDDEMWNGGKFRLVNLTDVSINKTYQTSIETENQWLSNKFKRKDKLKRFYDDISKILADASNDPIGKDNSSLYLPIAKELNRLSENSASKKVLLIYSDLLENTDQMSFYNKSTLSLLNTNPEKIKKDFESQLELKNLDGINIYLIFQPLNMKQDEVYKVVSSFYKDFFESKGASVEVVASIN